MLTPKFLTEQMAGAVIEAAVEMLYHMVEIAPKRQHLHVVVLVPGMRWNDTGTSVTVQPVILIEYTRGYQEDFEYPFDEIARNKASQLWLGHNDGRTDVMPHLLFTGDAPYWGGVKYEGIVVACSGIQPWLDKMLSGIIAHMLVGVAYDAWMNSQDKKDEVDCIT